jgi:hypothetical protein
VDLGDTLDASRREALEATVRAFKVLKQAKNQGVDVKPYRKRVKEATRLFEAGDYRNFVIRLEQIIAEVTGIPEPLS